MSSSSLRKVILIGGTSRIGPAIIKALLEATDFQVTVLSRTSSSSRYDDTNIKDVRIPDDMNHDDLVGVFRGQDVLVICIPGSLSRESIRFADAALEAGVKRVIPADFGSCDSADDHSLSLLPLYREKKKVRDHLELLSSTAITTAAEEEEEEKRENKFTWTSLITGHFLDYGIKSGLMQIDVTGRTARHFDGGDVPWSATTLADIGLATARILQNPDVTANRLLYVQSVLATQNQLLEAVESVTQQTFTVENVTSHDHVRDNLSKLESNPDDAHATEELVSVEGIVNGNWEERKNFANELLGLPQRRELHQIVKEALA